ncbi:helicase associated domain-containing protein [Streptomyces sp. MBT42]|nr:helicase associated domain-containing protein [Streptomyces sp. MBT42]
MPSREALRTARAYHQQHGHLAVPKEDSFGDYPLGAWLSNLRTPPHPPARPPSRRPPRALPVVERALEHAVAAHLAPSARPSEAHGPLKPTSSFPTTSYSLGEWLYLQCNPLHPPSTPNSSTCWSRSASTPQRRPPPDPAGAATQNASR